MHHSIGYNKTLAVGNYNNSIYSVLQNPTGDVKTL
jgi:hypothetical protein